MGIYDREYYRREGPSFMGALPGFGQACKWLILINIVCFVLQLVTRTSVEVEPRFNGRNVPAFQEYSPVTAWFELDNDAVLHGQVWRLLTYAFLHDTGTLWHILFNMLFLWWFGKDVEDLYGTREFLAFYLVAAVVGGLAFLLAGCAGLQDARPCLGASGAVMAVLVLCACHYPSRVIYVMLILPVPIWLFALFYVAQDAFAFISQASTTTAVAVHLGGAGFAFAYYKRHWRLWSVWTDLRGWLKQRSRPHLQVYREEPTSQPVSVAAPPRSEVDEHLEAKLDAVLEKVARYGQGSLSEGERQILFRASEVYKKRRT